MSCLNGMKSMNMFKTLLGLFLLLTAFKANAGLRFSFDLEACAWKATEIVVVTEGEEIDGQVVVLESLKGDLKSGERLTIPEFAVFKNEAFRKAGIDLEVLKANIIKTKRESNLLTSDYESDASIHRNEKLNNSSITGKRMMLFLTKSEVNSKVIWKPVCDVDGFFLSTIWIEPENAFVFYQRLSDEPNALLPIRLQEEQIKEQVVELMDLRSSFDRAIAISDAGIKAEALLPLARSPILFVKSAAFRELKNCGKSALPVLQILMNDLSITANSSHIFDAIGQLGDEQIGSELTGIISEELAFWKQTAPQLKVNWWNHFSDPETESLRNRYNRAYYAIIALRNLQFSGCKEVVSEFRDFWRSQPSLERGTELKQMSLECDRTLKVLNRQ